MHGFPVRASRVARLASRFLIPLQILALAFLFPLSIASAAPANEAGANVVQRVAAVPTTVSFSNPGRSVAPTVARSTPHVVAFHTRDNNAYVAAKSTANRLSVNAVATTPLTATGSVAVTTGFPTITADQQTARFGNDQYIEPPDPYVAAGSNYVVQTNNSVMSVWTKTGGSVSEVDLNAFARMPSGWYFTDPRITYDASTSRWFLSGMGIDANNDGAVGLFVSQTSDPMGSWSKYVFAADTNGVAHDQPKIGINDDKVVLAWDDYANLAFNSFIGSSLLVLQKSDLLAGTSAAGVFSSGDKTRFGVVPAQSLSSTTTEYMVYNNADPALSQNQASPTVGVMAVTGTPRTNDVNISETDLQMSATQMPPAATQPGGTVETNDDRFLNAVWQNGELWTSGNTGCTPSGDTSLRSCLRLVEIGTAPPAVANGPAVSLIQAVDYGYSGYDMYYPAVGMDSSNNLVVVFSGSSSTLYPSIAAFGAHVDTVVSSADTPVLLAKGLDTYTNARWGDFSGAAMDPADPTKVWVAGEYSAAPSGNWGTGLAEVSVP